MHGIIIDFKYYNRYIYIDCSLAVFSAARYGNNWVPLQGAADALLVRSDNVVIANSSICRPLCHTSFIIAHNNIMFITN